jgi:hypothetical protein
MAKPPDYGIIYNWDGAPHNYSEHPQSMEAFLEKMYAPLADTQVGAHFWCVGEHAAKWKSDVMEMVGDLYDRKYENASVYVHTENVRAMLERGEDPQEGAIKRGRELGMHVYASVRMNDNHFDGGQVEDLPRMHHSELTQMRIDHPEWVLGKEIPEWFALSWNMAVPEVREHRFEHVKELCTLYDWDGVELDWQRHGFHLPDDYGYRLKYVITDLQRAIRNMTNELSEKRGKPFYVAARVSGSLEMCRRIGYDIPVWIQEGLVDVLIPAASAATDPSIDAKGFVDLCEGTDVVVYPGFDGGLPDPHVGPEDSGTKNILRTRAIASRYHREGAQGIYVFNWHANRESRRELLTSVGTPDTLRGKCKVYAATNRFRVHEGGWRGAFQNDRIWGEVPVALKRTITGDGPTIVLDVADDLSADPPKRVELRLHLDQWVNGDAVRVLWDGQQLENPTIEYAHHSEPRISDVTAAAWIKQSLDADRAAQGPHTVQVILEQRNPSVVCDLVLTDVELLISYVD